MIQPNIRPRRNVHLATLPDDSGPALDSSKRLFSAAPQLLTPALKATRYMP